MTRRRFNLSLDIDFTAELDEAPEDYETALGEQLRADVEELLAEEWNPRVTLKGLRVEIIPIDPDEETAHLMRSPKNSRRLLDAIARANSAEDEPPKPRTAAKKSAKKGAKRGAKKAAGA